MKKDAYYFPHFCNARADRKLKRLRKELGIEGYGIYFMILEVLREQTDFKYPVEDIDLLADEFGTSEQKARAVVTNYNLFDVNDDETFFSPKLVEFLQPYLENKERKRVGGIKGNLIKYKKLSREQVDSMTDEQILAFKSNSSHTESVTESDTDRSTSQSKVKESKVKESKVNTNTLCLAFVENFNSINGIPKRSFRSTDSMNKIFKHISLRLKNFSKLEVEQFFQSLSESNYLFKESWFNLDYCVRSDDTFEKILNKKFAFKNNQSQGSGSYDLTKLFNS